MKALCVIYRTDRIGDFICSIPAIYAVREKLPNHHIVLVVSPLVYSLASLLPCVDECRIYDSSDAFPFTDVDYAILLNKQDDIFYKAVEGVSIQHRYGMWRQRSFFDRIRTFSFKERTETQKMLDYIKGIRSTSSINIESSFLPEQPIPYSIEKKDMVQDILQPFLERGKKIIVLSPIKEGSSKVIADSFYPTILQTIHARFPHVAIIVVVSEFDREKGESIMRSLPTELERCLLFVNTSDLSTLVALIDACDIFIGSSSGPTHIAGLLNKKIIACYPYNKGHSPARWGVPGGGDKVRYILSEKRIDELPMTHPKRFGETHLEELCSYIREFCTNG